MRGRGHVPVYGECGNRLLAVKETLSLCGLAGIFEEYVPVSLARKNVYKLKKIKRCAKICRDTSCAPE